MALMSVLGLKRWVSKPRFQIGQVFVRLVLKLQFSFSNIAFLVVTGLCLATRTSTTLHCLYQRNIYYFSYPSYYTVSTGMVVSNLGGCQRKNFKITLVDLATRDVRSQLVYRIWLWVLIHGSKFPHLLAECEPVWPSIQN